MEDGHHIVADPEHAAERAVDPARAEPGERPDVGQRAGRIAREEPGERDRIDAEVEQGATGQVDPSVPAVLDEDGDAEIRLDDREPTDLAGFDAALDVDDRGDEPRPHRLHQEASLTACRVDHRRAPPRR